MTVTSLAMFVMTAMVLAKQHRLHQELKYSNQVLEEASMTDPLTGILNRRFFRQRSKARLHERCEPTRKGMTCCVRGDNSHQRLLLAVRSERLLQHIRRLYSLVCF